MSFRDTRKPPDSFYLLYIENTTGVSQDLCNDIVEQTLMKRFLANLGLQ